MEVSSFVKNIWKMLSMKMRRLFSVCCSLAQLLTICISYAFYYAKLSSIESLFERERVAVNMQGTVFTLARLKIVPSYYQELVSPSMPEPVEALGYSLFSLKITSANFPRQLLTI